MLSERLLSPHRSPGRVSIVQTQLFRTTALCISICITIPSILDSYYSYTGVGKTVVSRFGEFCPCFCLPVATSASRSLKNYGNLGPTFKPSPLPAPGFNLLNFRASRCNLPIPPSLLHLSDFNSTTVSYVLF